MTDNQSLAHIGAGVSGILNIPDTLGIGRFHGTLVLFLDQIGTKKIGSPEREMPFYRIDGLFRVC